MSCHLYHDTSYCWLLPTMDYCLLVISVCLYQEGTPKVCEQICTNSPGSVHYEPNTKWLDFEWGLGGHWHSHLRGHAPRGPFSPSLMHTCFDTVLQNLAHYHVNRMRFLTVCSCMCVHMCACTCVSVCQGGESVHLASSACRGRPAAGCTGRTTRQQHWPHCCWPRQKPSAGLCTSCCNQCCSS